MELTQQTEGNISEIFSEYLEANNLRKTSERYSILNEIYARNDHFDADSLYVDLKKKNIAVSRATVYNTLDLLVSCSLITKHSFNNSQAVYEKSHNYRQHDHIVCINCKEVKEFCDPRIHQITSKMSELLNYEITHHSLVLYGLCEKCQKNNRKKT